MSPSQAQQAACRLSLSAGDAALAREDFAEAQRRFGDARQKAELAGPEYPCLSASLGGIGDALFGQGLYAEAVPVYRRVLKITEAALGPDHPEVATALVHLGDAHFRATHDTSAEPILRRALIIRKRELGDHEDVAAILELIAVVRFSNAEAVSAEGLLGDAARMRARFKN